MVKVIVLTGFGINCEKETAHAFYKAGAEPLLIHLNDLLENPTILDTSHIFSIPGGFSFGDDIASGRILANRLKYRLESQILKFIRDGKLIIGICNGFQVMVKMGILPLFDNKFEQNVTLSHNDSGRFEDRWVKLKINTKSPCVWTTNIDFIELPVRHGEGKFISKDSKILNELHSKNQIVLQYARDRDTLANGEYPLNPNGSVDDIAGICDPSGRILGMMPHPEAFWDMTLHPQWNRKKLKGEGEGMKIFRNGIEYATKNL
ncbi:MAG: phosphoribosylformylglycinamidine synthase subunit PurQ [Candidatus Hydrogenedentes bacterium]|nr:phosphoribosylformylglycinamidine synthase subunit PurQ [Candidatus Hydrogenedentota bacterium]